jgi:hypothetical protein
LALPSRTRLLDGSKADLRRFRSPASAILGTIGDKILSLIFASALVQAQTRKVEKAKIRQCLCG